jgi:hypothetical protein
VEDLRPVELEVLVPGKALAKSLRHGDILAVLSTEAFEKT